MDPAEVWVPKGRQEVVPPVSIKYNTWMGWSVMLSMDKD
jgi:hypothetical protein